MGLPLLAFLLGGVAEACVPGAGAAETAKRGGKARGAWLLGWGGLFVLLVLAGWMLMLVQLMLTHISSSTQPSCTLSPFARHCFSIPCSFQMPQESLKGKLIGLNRELM